MKKYILSVLSIAFLGLTSCTEDIMDDINKDNQHPSPENVSAASIAIPYRLFDQPNA